MTPPMLRNVKKSSICFILFEFESYLKTDMNRIVIPKSLSGPSGSLSAAPSPGPSQIMFALIMMNHRDTELCARPVEFNFLRSFVWSNLIITLTDKNFSLIFDFFNS